MLILYKYQLVLLERSEYKNEENNRNRSSSSIVFVSIWFCNGYDVVASMPKPEPVEIEIENEDMCGYQNYGQDRNW